MNETRSGEDGWDALLGDEFDWLSPDGDDGLAEAFALESVRWMGIGSMGLPSRTGPGEVAILGPLPLGLVAFCLLCAARASARSF